MLMLVLLRMLMKQGQKLAKGVAWTGLGVKILYDTICYGEERREEECLPTYLHDVRYYAVW